MTNQHHHTHHILCGHGCRLGRILLAGWGATLLASHLFAVPAVSAANVAAVQRERLERYAAVRTSYDPAAACMLIGNAELGGLATASGTGFRNLHAADLWRESGQYRGERTSYHECWLACPDFPKQRQPSSYRQELRLTDGVVKTRVEYAADSGYEAELFCSRASRRLIVLKLTSLSKTATQKWYWNNSSYIVSSPAADLLYGQINSTNVTQHAWVLRLSRPWQQEGRGSVLALGAGETVTLTFSLVTRWAEADFAGACQKMVRDAGSDYAALAAAQNAAWSGLWQQAAVLAIPDRDFEQMWYRSLFWTLCTCGSERFLPGESQFAYTCWGMYPFTYGAAGWGAQALITAGFPHEARAMLDWHYKPEALRKNAEFFTRRLIEKPALPEALSFAHSAFPDGRNMPSKHYELQRHIDGFAGAFFYRYSRFYPDAKYQRDVVYPVLSGVAEFYRGLTSVEPKSGSLVLPKITSLTEDLIAPNVIDATLAAKWSWLLADRLAGELGVDDPRRAEWRRLAEQICLPQDPDRYLEFFGDNGRRPGAGYMGVRGFAYLGYPTLELVPQLDAPKAARTLDSAWLRNREGEGMIGFVANWYALSDTSYGRGDHALAILRHNLKCLDQWGLGLKETADPKCPHIYFTDNYTSFLMVPLAMAVQSYDHRISICPAVPTAWKEFAFYNVPAEDGIRVSGEMIDGKIAYVDFQKDGRSLLRLNEKRTVRILRKSDSLKLEVLDRE